MANKKPFFITGATAKIALNGKTMAFATDISYSIAVKHASPRVLGRFEVEVHQPLSYDVSGSFTIIRYAKGLKSGLSGHEPEGVNDSGNGVGNWKMPGTLGGIAGAYGLPTAGQFDGAAHEALDPARMYQSKMFDIDIYQKTDAGECHIARLKDCRITTADFNMSKKELAKERFNFVCRYAHEDTFLAGGSGVGQELT